VSIRTLQHEDLPAAARLCARVEGWDIAGREAALVDYFADIALDGPLADPAVPSLVYDDGNRGITGFILSQSRPFSGPDGPLKMACSGPLVADPDAGRGIGALLLKRYLAGAQDFTVTDNATDEVMVMWKALGGSVNTTASVGWTRLLGPASVAIGFARRRRGVYEPPALGLIGTVDRVVGGPLRPQRPTGTIEPLDPGTAVELLMGMRRHFPIRPAYGDGQLRWLLDRLDGSLVRGEVVARLVRAPGGRALGWYVMSAAPRGVAQALQVVAAPADCDVVIDHLFAHAAEIGAAEVRGRLEPHLFPSLRERRHTTVRTDWSLVAARDGALLGSILGGGALLTRLDGEWWMQPPYVALPDSRARSARS